MQMNQEQNKNPMIVQEDAEGLSITVHTASTEPDFTSMLVYFVGIAMTLAGGAVIVNSNNWFGLLPLLTGFSLTMLMYWYRTIKKQGAVNHYCVSVAGDTATFIHNRRTMAVLSRSKIGRIWITEHRRSGMPVGHDITVYHDGIEQHLFTISDAVETLGSGDQLLDLIVTYLNSAPAGKESPQGTATEPSAAEAEPPAEAGGTILSGYRSDYATNTTPAARDTSELAPLKVRIGYSLAMALLLLLLVFLPYHPSIAWIVPFYDDSLWNFFMIFATQWIIAPLAFSIVLSFCGACNCRHDGKDWIMWPFLPMVSAWLLQSAINLVTKQFALDIPDSVIVVAMVALMSWIFFRVINGCSCGSHPERG